VRVKEKTFWCLWYCGDFDDDYNINYYINNNNNKSNNIIDDFYINSFGLGAKRTWKIFKHFFYWFRQCQFFITSLLLSQNIDLFMYYINTIHVNKIRSRFVIHYSISKKKRRNNLWIDIFYVKFIMEGLKLKSITETEVITIWILTWVLSNKIFTNKISN